MNRQEILSMLSILKKAYPNFYRNLTKQEAEDTVLLYEEMFKDCNGKLVLLTIKELINTYEYPPTIATIKKKMYELTHINEESNSELWEKLLKAIRNGYYGAEEEFKMLPNIIKEFLGSPEQLRSIAEMDSETIHSVVKGQFLKQIENLKERVRQKEMMTNEMKNLLTNEVKLIEE
jgi:hypothetical protein